MPITFLALGSNLGDRRRVIFQAGMAIARWPKARFRSWIAGFDSNIRDISAQNFSTVPLGVRSQNFASSQPSIYKDGTVPSFDEFSNGTNCPRLFESRSNAPNCGTWPKTKILDASEVVETRALGFAHQPKFLNCVLKIETNLSPMALLIWAKKTELLLGRKPRFRWGPREIDIDILLYGRERIKTPLLQIPHPRMNQRDFIVKGLAELGYH